MITTELKGNRVEMRAFGNLGLSDCQEFAEQADYSIRFHGPIDLLLDLRNMADFSLDALLAELRYARKHAGDFRRIAVLSDDQWVNLAMLLTDALVDGELMVFSDESFAKLWLEDGSEGAASSNAADVSH